MNLSALILGFMGIALIAGMIMFIGATQSVTVTDSYGNVSGAAGNSTDLIVQNVTNIGGRTTGYLVLVIAALVIIGGVAMLALYGKTK